MALLKSAAPITPKSIPIMVHMTSLLNFGVTAGGGDSGGVGGGRTPVNTVLNIPRLILDNIKDYFYEKNVGKKSKKRPFSTLRDRFFCNLKLRGFTDNIRDRYENSAKYARKFKVRILEDF